MRRDIRLPHLGYTIHIRPFKYDPAYSNADALFECTTDNHHCCTLYLKDKASVGIIVHEVIHALQHICAVRHIAFTSEDEHVAYMAQHIVETILDAQQRDGKKRLNANHKFVIKDLRIIRAHNLRMSNVVHVPYPLTRKAMRWMFKARPRAPYVWNPFGEPSLRHQIDEIIDKWHEDHPDAPVTDVVYALTSLLNFYSH